MARTILEVDATIVDANGAFNHITNYPKRFDSNSYEGDLEGTMKRAKAEYHSTLSSMYGNQAGRQIQTVVLRNVRGDVILRECIGNFPADAPEEPVEQ
jgi:hypothetical protein